MPTPYERLCEAYFEREPGWLVIETALRELPSKLRDSVSSYLNVPTQSAAFPTIIAGGQPTPYVAVYRRVSGKSGEVSWEVCPRGEEFQFDQNGIAHFTLGVCLEKRPGVIPASMMFMELSVEEIGEHLAELLLARAGRKLKIDFNDPAGYGRAAASLIGMLLDCLAEPPKSRGGLRGPLGF